MFAFYGQKVHGYDHTLEQRADVVLMRAGLTPTVAASRQRINHRHVSLNGTGEPLQTPAARLKPGDVVFLHPLAKEERIVPKSDPNDGSRPLTTDPTARVAQLLWASLWAEQGAATHKMLRTLFPALSLPPASRSLREEVGLEAALSNVVLSPATCPTDATTTTTTTTTKTTASFSSLSSPDHPDLSVAVSGQERGSIAVTSVRREKDGEKNEGGWGEGEERGSSFEQTPSSSSSSSSSSREATGARIVVHRGGGVVGGGTEKDGGDRGREDVVAWFSRPRGRPPRSSARWGAPREKAT